MIIFVQDYKLLVVLMVRPKTPLTSHMAVHRWWRTGTQGHKYGVVPADNIGELDPCDTRDDNILIRILWMSLILMVVLTSLTGVRTMLTLHGLRRSLMSKLRLPIIFLNKRNRGYYYLNESKGITLDRISWKLCRVCQCTMHNRTLGLMAICSPWL